MGHKFRTAKVLRTCLILKAKFLTTWTTVHAGKLFLNLPERTEFDRCHVLYLPYYAPLLFPTQLTAFSFKSIPQRVGNSEQFLTALKLCAASSHFTSRFVQETGYILQILSWTLTKRRGQLVQMYTGHILNLLSWAPGSQRVALFEKKYKSS